MRQIAAVRCNIDHNFVKFRDRVLDLFVLQWCDRTTLGPSISGLCRRTLAGLFEIGAGLIAIMR